MADDRRRTPARITLTVIGLVLLTALGLLLVYEVRRVLVWILIALFFATALYPAVNWVERRGAWCKRWLATLMVFIVVFVALLGIVALFVVPLVREGSRLIAQLPGMVRDARAGEGPVGQLIERYNLMEYVQRYGERLGSAVGDLGAPTLAILTGAFTTVAGIVTIFVLAYLMVLEGPRLTDAFLALFEPTRGERIRRVGADCARTVTGYLTGNLLISAICGTLTYIVLLIMDVPYAGLLALFVALADLIPLIGATLGAVVATIVAFTHSTTAGIVVLVFFLLYQQLENHLLQPVILSRAVKINALAALLAILIGVELAGILGALLAIPIAGIIQVVARDVWDERRGRPKAEPTVGEEEIPVSQATPPEELPGGNAPPPPPPPAPPSPPSLAGTAPRAGTSE